MCAALPAAAQEAPRSAYFLDGYSFRHELNPAFSGERNYISIPALGNLDLGVFSNVGVNTFLYKTEPGSPYKLTDKLNVGAKLKVLLGLGSAYADIKKMDVAFGYDKWQIQAEGELKMAAGKGLYVPTRQESGKEIKNPGEADLIEWGDIDYDKFGLSGFGLGIDLGATYDLLPDLQLSAAINDLGFMSWSNAVTGRTGTGTWTFDGFNNIAVDDSQPGYDDNKLDEQFDRLWDDLQDVVNIHREDNGSGSYTKALRATLHLGAEYKMPFYRNLTGGFLFSSHFAGCSSWTEGRFFANVKPVKWFDATINYGASTYGSSFGWMLNFHPKGFNFFIGSDHQFFSITPQVLPVGKATANINIGFNVTFGS